MDNSSGEWVHMHADFAHSERIECVHDLVHGGGEAELQPCYQIDEGDELSSEFGPLHVKHGRLRCARSELAFVVDDLHRRRGVKVQVKALRWMAAAGP